MKSNGIGSFGWNEGPLLVAPRRLHEHLLADGTSAAPLSKKRGRLSKALLDDAPIWALKAGNPTRAWTFGPQCLVLVRVMDSANPVTELPRVLSYHPGWAADRWKAIRGSFPMTAGALCLFNCRARRNPPGPRPDDDVFSFELSGGAGTSNWQAAWQEVEFESKKLLLLRLVAEGHTPAIDAPAAAPGPPGPVSVTPDTMKSALELSFVHTDGGPVLLLPADQRDRWFGVNDAAGEHAFDKMPTHYDLASEATGLFQPVPCGAGVAWALESPDGTAFHPLPDGGLIVRWVGADNPQSLLAGALAAPACLWERSAHVLESTAGFLLMDAAADGRDASNTNIAEVSLPPGRYDVDTLLEWRGEVQIDDRLHGTMVQAVRLTLKKD